MQPWEIELLSSRLFFSMPWYVYVIGYFLIMGLLIGAHEAISPYKEDENNSGPPGPSDSLVWVIWPISLPFLLAFTVAYYPFVYGKKAFHKIKDMVKSEVAW